MGKTVLLFNINVLKAGQIQAFCREQGIKTILVQKEDYGQRLGAIAGISGIKKKSTGAVSGTFDGEMMAFSGINSDDLDDFLDDYRAAGIAPVTRKAVLTPYNIMWTPMELYKALNSEIRSNI